MPWSALTSLTLGHGAGGGVVHPAILPAPKPAFPLPWRQGTSTHCRETPQLCSPGSSGLCVEIEQICISLISYLEGSENIQLSQTVMLFVSGDFLVTVTSFVSGTQAQSNGASTQPVPWRCEERQCPELSTGEPAVEAASPHCP